MCRVSSTDRDMPWMIGKCDAWGMGAKARSGSFGPSVSAGGVNGAEIAVSLYSLASIKRISIICLVRVPTVNGERQTKLHEHERVEDLQENHI